MAHHMRDLTGLTGPTGLTRLLGLTGLVGYSGQSRLRANPRLLFFCPRGFITAGGELPLGLLGSNLASPMTGEEVALRIMTKRKKNVKIAE